MEDNEVLDITGGDAASMRDTTEEKAMLASSPSPVQAAPDILRHPEVSKAPILEDPYDFEQCTVTFTFTLLPADGDARGRRVVISARNHLDAPIFAEGEWRLADLVGEQAMPKVSVDLAKRIVADLPARASANQAKQAVQTLAEKSKGKGTRGKQGQPPAPSQLAIPAASDGQDRPRAASRNQHGQENAVQLSMFEVFTENQEVTDGSGNA